MYLEVTQNQSETNPSAMETQEAVYRLKRNLIQILNEEVGPHLNYYVLHAKTDEEREVAQKISEAFTMFHHKIYSITYRS